CRYCVAPLALDSHAPSPSFRNDTSPTHTSTLSLHDALPILGKHWKQAVEVYRGLDGDLFAPWFDTFAPGGDAPEIGQRWRSPDRSEEHTSELQSRENLVCRLLLAKKKATSPLRRLTPGRHIR